VDILVTSHLRHADNQDTEHRCTPSGLRSCNFGRQDSKMASLEVMQVLTGVRGPFSALDGESIDIESMNVPYCSKIDS
jgi:hypothetical protein